MVLAPKLSPPDVAVPKLRPVLGWDDAAEVAKLSPADVVAAGVVKLSPVLAGVGAKLSPVEDAVLKLSPVCPVLSPV